MSADILQPWLDELPLVPILRGLRPQEAVTMGRVLLDAGYRVLEVPLNSPDPFDSIAALARSFGDEALVGAGTVIDPADVARIAAVGGKLIVMPHGDPAVIREAKRAGLVCVPGVATPTEAFAALAAGADALKLFPAEMLGPSVVKAFKAVLPRAARLLPVGGITPESMAPFVAAGAAGFGIGSALYRPGASTQEVGDRAGRFVNAWRGLARES